MGLIKENSSRNSRTRERDNFLFDFVSDEQFKIIRKYDIMKDSYAKEARQRVIVLVFI